MKAARLKAWLPMSPIAPPPDCAGSVRQDACFCPVSSSLVVSQSCGYSTWTTRMVPSSPAHPRARLAHHRVAGVVVGQPEHQTGAPHGVDQVERVVDRGGHRLVADHVDAGLEERLGGGMVDVVRGDDRDHVDAVVARRLLRRHFLEGW